MEPMTPDKLESIKKKADEAGMSFIRVGMSTCGIAAGADDAYKVLEEEIAKRGLKIALKKCGCLGMCFAEPLVEVCVEGCPPIIYGKVDKAAAHRIVEEHLCAGRILNDHIYELRCR